MIESQVETAHTHVDAAERLARVAERISLVGTAAEKQRTQKDSRNRVDKRTADQHARRAKQTSDQIFGEDERHVVVRFVVGATTPRVRSGDKGRTRCASPASLQIVVLRELRSQT